MTADGSMDCMSNPGEQESLVEHLHFCELIIALSVLSLGNTQSCTSEFNYIYLLLILNILQVVLSLLRCLQCLNVRVYVYCIF